MDAARDFIDARGPAEGRRGDQMPPKPAADHSRGILDHLLEGCQIISPDWRYVYVNDAVVRHSRKERGDLLGQRMMDVFPGIEQTPMFTALERCMDRREPSRLLNEFTYPDGPPALVRPPDRAGT